MLSVGW
jgi:hypothetical protein